MIYSLLRAIARLALRWYYADVTVAYETRGHAASIAEGPMIVVVNHPNALVDVLVAGQAMPRRLMFTAKSTLFSNPIARWLLSVVGVVPLRRSSDENSAAPDPTRNSQVFEAITQSLARGRAVLIFPEGITHDEPALTPLRTGAARMALHARDSNAVRGLRILPIGLVFEVKDAMRSRVLAVVGQPLDVDTWRPVDPTLAVSELTAEIESRLRGVTLNYGSVTEAAIDTQLAVQISALIRYESPSLGTVATLRDQTTVAQLLPAVRQALQANQPTLATRADAFQASLTALQRSLDAHHISLDDLAISRGIREGAAFVGREALLLLTAGPIALWGWVNHVIPFHAAIAMGRRKRESASDPAMRTIVAGVAFVMMVYMLQGAAIALVAGPWWALVYVASLPVAADINLRFRDRLARAARRGRTYLLFRAHPSLHDELEGRAQKLRDEALALAGATGVVRPV